MYKYFSTGIFGFQGEKGEPGEPGAPGFPVRIIIIWVHKIYLIMCFQTP